MASPDPPARTWDASVYHRISGPMVEMGRQVLDRLPLRGDETVLDAGCGTGRVTAELLDRLPRGRVIAVDADPAMVDKAAEYLAEHLGVTSFDTQPGQLIVRRADLLQLDIDAEVDAVISTATFHWILDHDLLFANLLRSLRPTGRLVAQCGGAGNIAAVLDAADAVASNARWAAKFEGWTRPSHMASAEDTTRRLERAGFIDVRCWLEPSPVVPEEPIAYLATIVLGAHIQRLDEADRADFVSAVDELLPKPTTIDYIRLNIDAVKPRG